MDADLNNPPPANDVPLQDPVHQAPVPQVPQAPPVPQDPQEQLVYLVNSVNALATGSQQLQAQLLNTSQQNEILLQQFIALQQAHEATNAQLQQVQMNAALPHQAPQPPLPQAPQPPVAHVASKFLLPCKPTPYSGDRLQLREFLQQCNIFLSALPDAYANDRSRILFIASYLRGPALSWYATRVPTDPILSQLAPFIAAFRDAFGDREITASAISAIQRLTQGKLSVLDYITKFQLLAADVPWDDSALMTFFIRGLNSDIRIGFGYQARPPATLADCVSLAVSIWNSLQNNAYLESQAHSGPSPMDIGAVRTATDRPKSPGRGPLSAEERQNRIDNRLCFYCGKPNHVSKNCRLKKRAVNVIDVNKRPPSAPYPIVSCPTTLASVNNSAKVHTLIDSGASISVMDESFSVQAAIPTQNSTDTTPILSVEGRPIGRAKSTPMLSVELGNYKFNQAFKIIKSPRNPLILGYDWLRENNPDIDWRKGTISSFRNGKYSHNQESIAACSASLKPSLKKEKHVSFTDLPIPPRPSPPPEVLDLPQHHWGDTIEDVEEDVIDEELPPVTEPTLVASVTVSSDSPRRKPSIWTFLNPLAELPEWYARQDRLVKDITKTCAKLFGDKPVCVVDLDEPRPTLPTQKKPDKPALPDQYKEFADVFEKAPSEKLPEHREFDCAIDLIPGTTPPFGPLYNLSENELKALKAELDEQLRKGWIRPSKSAAASPVLFVTKKDGTLRLCVDYRKINEITVKDRYPLPLITGVIQHLGKAKYFTKIDLRKAYNLLRIKAGDEWKTAFRTRFGLFESLVTNFGLTNAPPTFQRFINSIFHDILDIYLQAYLDDLLIYSDTLEEHREHVKEVLKRLRENNLFANLEKCEFEKQEVTFLGYHISTTGVSTDPAKVQAIRDWPTPTNMKQVQRFLGFANFYRTFIDNFADLAVPLNNLTRKDTPFHWSAEADSAFHNIKLAFCSAPVLRHPDTTKKFYVSGDASDFAIGATLSQEFDGKLHPVAYLSRKLDAAELNYEIHDKELLVIIESFRTWRYLLEGAAHKVTVYTDHRNLTHWRDSRHLNRRQVRWSQIISSMNFEIIYRRGADQAAPDAMSRRPDYKNKGKEPPQVLLPGDLFSNIEDSNETVFALSQADFPYWNKDVLLVPKPLRLRILQDHHDALLTGHPGIKRTLELIQRSFYWPNMHIDVDKYVKSCDTCCRNKSSRHAPYGKLVPLPVPSYPWQSVSIDFITDLPLCEGFDSIMVVTCRHSKMSHFIPCNKTTDAPELTKLFVANIIRLHGIPKDITSDRGPQFTSKFWSNILQALGIKQNLTTAFHPASNGQVERVNQSLELYLRCFCNYQQDNWVSLLPTAEFSNNNHYNASTQVSPFFVVYGRNLDFNPAIRTSCPASDEVSQALTDIWKYTQDNIKEAQQAYKKFADRHRSNTPEFKIGDLVWLSRKNIPSIRPLGKLDHRKVGPFKIIGLVGEAAFRLELPPTMKIHNVFHAALLSSHIDNTFEGRIEPEPDPVVIDDHVEYEVEQVLDSRLHYGKLQYFIHWKGKSVAERTWEPASHTVNAPDKVKEFHLHYPTKPAPSNTPSSSSYDWNAFNQLQLRQVLKQNGLKTGGSIAELRKRLKSHKIDPKNWGGEP